MSRVILPFKNKLVYPGTSPGFDPSHPASKGCVWSAIAVGGTAINICNAKIGSVISSAPTAVIDSHFGMADKFTGVFSNGIQFTSAIPAVTQNNCTMACIIRPADNGATGTRMYIATATSATQGWWMGTTGTGSISLGLFVAGALSSNIAPNFIPIVGTPYFIALSIINTSGSTYTTNWVIKELNTGKLYTYSVSGSTTLAASDGGVVFAGSVYIGDCFGNMATNMFTDKVALSLPELVKWSEDPWSFWYPHPDLALFTLSKAAIADVLMAQILL